MKYNQVLIDGYFLIVKAHGLSVDYKSIDYFASAEKLNEYMRREYSGTDFSAVCDYSHEKLMEGVSLSVGNRQGTQVTNAKILLIHGSNLSELFNMVDKLDVTDLEGYKLYLSNFLKEAETEDEIEEIIEIYNDGQDNYW